MAVHRPGVGFLHALGEMLELLRSCGPKPKSAIDMNPGSGLVGLVTNFIKGIKSAGAYIAGLQDNDGMIIERRHLGCDHSPLSVSIHPRDVLQAETQ